MSEQKFVKYEIKELPTELSINYTLSITRDWKWHTCDETSDYEYRSQLLDKFRGELLLTITSSRGYQGKEPEIKDVRSFAAAGEMPREPERVCKYT